MGGSKGKRDMVIILDKNRSIIDQNETIKMLGSCIHLTMNKMIIDHIVIKVMADTSIAGNNANRGSCSKVPCLFSITLKKKGKAIKTLKKTIVATIVLILNTRLLHAFRQAMAIARLLLF